MRGAESTIGHAAKRVRRWFIPLALVAPGVGWNGTAGSGYSSAPTESASQIGAGTEKAIARVDLYNNYTINGVDVEVGVMAFHESGINYVDWYVEADAATRVSTPTISTRTDAPVYSVMLDDSAFSGDGSATLYARVVPVDGYERLLTLTVRRNTGGTVTAKTKYVSSTGSDSNSGNDSAHPYLTIEKAMAAFWLADTTYRCSNGTIKLAEGDYDWTFPNSFVLTNFADTVPLTIEAADPTKKLTTRINRLVAGTFADSTYTNIRFHNITVACQLYVTATAPKMYFESCDFTDPVNGRAADPDNEGGDGASGWNYWTVNVANMEMWATDCTFHDCFHGPTGFNLINVSVTACSNDAIENCPFVCYGTLTDVNETLWNAAHGTSPGVIHTDLGSMSLGGNAFWYGVKATNCSGQGLYISADFGDVVGVAFVNCVVGMLNPTTTNSQFDDKAANVRHVLVLNCTIDQAWNFRGDTAVNHWQFKDTIFRKANGSTTGVTFSNVALIDTSGTSTIGSPTFSNVATTAVWVDPVNWNYTPKAGGPAVNAATVTNVLTDAAGNTRKTGSNHTAIGALAAVAETAPVSTGIAPILNSAFGFGFGF